jgi:thiol-disulfide isomerase/thioredoxin
MKRRSLVVGAAGAAALGAGLAWQQWRERTAAAGAAAAGVPWNLRFARPDGGELVMARLLGQPLVLNFWATWCPPCVKEMPELDRFQGDFAARGWRVVGLAIDNVPAVREFLRRQPVRYEIALAGFEGVSLVRELGNDAGGLPYTIVFDAEGAARQRKLGETSYAELAGWAGGR